MYIYLYTPTPWFAHEKNSVKTNEFSTSKQKRRNCADEVEHGMAASKRTVPLLGFIWGLHKT